ncbi:hypothetical protein JJV70_05415 [Streptomyces sp. JJ66]|uniref:hypothetical protein n=1 Tax=Streptomyces sp. JJ66 TaxID=2803843 RepID=UPI001C564AF6|nr:hypothetical protein [Streptomyces sp. JJ66]MBW1601555.1 hypothetical protein [Streptomyces sp. JJ66]
MLSARKVAFGAASAALAGTVTLTLVGVAGAGPADRPAADSAVPAAALPATALPDSRALAAQARQLDYLGELISAVSELVEDVARAPGGELSTSAVSGHRREVRENLRDLRRTLRDGARTPGGHRARVAPTPQSVEVGGADGVRVEWNNAKDAWLIDFGEWSVSAPQSGAGAQTTAPTCLPVQLPDIGITYPTLPIPVCADAVPALTTGPTGTSVTVDGEEVEVEDWQPQAEDGAAAHTALDELEQAVNVLFENSVAREPQRTQDAANAVLERLNAVMSALAGPAQATR